MSNRGPAQAPSDTSTVAGHNDTAITAYIGLGSNLDAPLEQVMRAFDELAALPETRLVQCSRLYRSAPVGPEGQPDYINAVALIETRLDAHRLLDELQAIEKAHQRVRLEHWGPRTLDLDLLLYGDEHIDSERLKVPHPFISQRNFVLYPLNDIAPDLILPFNQSLESLLQSCGSEGLTVLDSPELNSSRN